MYLAGPNNSIRCTAKLFYFTFSYVMLFFEIELIDFAGYADYNNNYTYSDTIEAVRLVANADKFQFTEISKEVDR